jgi:succinoglycan biosynthesis protein ExoV
MKLQYHPGKNFGDQLNPWIFNHYLPGYFQNDNGYVFMGIGSILGFYNKYQGKKVVFSSGYDASLPSTYGVLPKDKTNFDFICVRGPLTASLLEVDASLAVTDGAILLKNIVEKENQKKYKIALMPHVGSEEFYDHQKLCDALGWHYISPSWDVEVVLKMIQQSECLITEAMHGAIVADTLRVPWKAYQGFKTIGNFKWQDWCMSMELEYAPFVLHPYFDGSKLDELVRAKFGSKKLQFLPTLLSPLIRYLMKRRWNKNLDILKKELLKKNFLMSNNAVFEDRHQRILQKLDDFKSKYPIEKFG